MALAASCDALYFPSEPRDNIVTLHWGAGDAPLPPSTSVIFKVKCTAPQLFRALPRYGALLLTDANGVSMPPSSQRATIRFSLRSNHSDVEDEVGSHRNSGVPTRLASRSSRAATSGKPYQERFAVDYVVIRSEPLAFQQISASFTDGARLAEVVKGIWSLTDSGAIPRAHLGSQGGVSLKVYMENVVLQPSDPAPSGGDESTKIVVPPEARLVVPSAVRLHTPSDQHATKAGHRQSALSSSEQSPGSTRHQDGGWATARRKPTDELRALREEINSMRNDSLTPRSTVGPSVRNSSPPSTSTPTVPMRQRDGAEAAELPASPRASVAAARPVNLDDLIMKIDVRNSPAATPRRGLRVYVTLVLMLALYISLLITRRSGTRVRGRERSGINTEEAETARALQISS